MVIIISPLIALMIDQVKEANLKTGLELNAVCLDASAFTDIAEGKFNLVFGSPEAWVDNARWRNLLSTKMFRNNLACIVVDEAHKVTWGESSLMSRGTTKAPFRESFSRINELRSVLCGEGIPVLALTATANADVSELILSSCGLSKSVSVISSSADRKNIRLSLVRLKGKNIACLNWIIDGLVEYGTESPKIIIYCRTVKLVRWLFEQLLISLGENAYIGKKKHATNLLIGMFHAQTVERNKQRVLNSLTGKGPVRLFVATSTLGCGINASEVMFVVHFGPPFGLADYCQQIGRAGRNCQYQCHAVLYYYPMKRATILFDDMIKYIDHADSKCLRKTLFTPFSEDGQAIQSLIPGHLCCSYCASCCDCTERCEVKYQHEFLSSDVIDAELKEVRLKYREVSYANKAVFRQALQDYLARLVSSDMFMFVPVPYVSGLTNDVIDSVLENLPYLKSVENVLKLTKVVHTRVASEIIQMIFELFGDVSVPTTESSERCLFLFEGEKIESDDSDNEYVSDLDIDGVEAL